MVFLPYIEKKRAETNSNQERAGNTWNLLERDETSKN